MNSTEYRDVSFRMAGATHNGTLMERARGALRGKWGLCIGVSLVYMFIIGIFSGTRHAGVLFSFLLTGPMTLGMSIFFLNIARNKNPRFADIFEGFNRAGTAILAHILLTLFVALWTLLLIIPGIAAALSYSMTFFVIADHKNIGASDALKLSKRLMRGHRLKLLCLGFRFIGWGILCVLSMGIGFLWLFPQAGFAGEARGQKPEASRNCPQINGLHFTNLLRFFVDDTSEDSISMPQSHCSMMISGNKTAYRRRIRNSGSAQTFQA